MIVAEKKPSRALSADNNESFPTNGPAPGPIEIGRGRSGIVYKERNEAGREVARKVFDSRGLTRFVQWVTMGAPNPYMWSEDAVQCARIRRNILSRLVPYWMEDSVAVADADLVTWNEPAVAYELHTEFVNGRPAALHHTLRGKCEDEAVLLWQEVMPRLRMFLEQSGFTGLLWQAGIGNPVALNNFLLELSVSNVQDATQLGKNRWIWIDLESGVPAIFPISPKVFLNYSIRHWWRSRRPSFDDVDVDCLRSYLDTNATALESALGAEAMKATERDVDLLEEYQARWKSVGRIDGAIQYRLSQRQIGEQQAEFYSKHRLLWLCREFGRGMRSTVSLIPRAVASLIRRIRNLKLLDKARNALMLLLSQRRRTEFIHNYLDGCIAHWHSRGQISASHAAKLRERIGSPESSVYISDFGVHVAIKPIVKSVQYLVLPGLFAMGLVSGPVTAFLIVAGGAMGRTAYTLGRIIQLSRGNHSRPWVALVVGVLPVVGNLAFPTQVLFSVRGENEILARFMLDDGFARIGRYLPIWGGEDTWTEHFFNRLPSKTVEYWAVKWRASVASRAS